MSDSIEEHTLARWPKKTFCLLETTSLFEVAERFELPLKHGKTAALGSRNYPATIVVLLADRSLLPHPPR